MCMDKNCVDQVAQPLFWVEYLPEYQCQVHFQNQWWIVWFFAYYQPSSEFHQLCIYIFRREMSGGPSISQSRYVHHTVLSVFHNLTQSVHSHPSFMRHVLQMVSWQALEVCFTISQKGIVNTPLRSILFLKTWVSSSKSGAFLFFLWHCLFIHVIHTGLESYLKTSINLPLIQCSQFMCADPAASWILGFSLELKSGLMFVSRVYIWFDMTSFRSPSCFSAIHSHTICGNNYKRKASSRISMSFSFLNIHSTSTSWYNFHCSPSWPV